MDRKEWAVIAASIKTFYSREEKLIPNQQAMELWFQQLQDIPYEIAELVLKKWVATNKWSPSIADFRAMAAEIVTGKSPDWGEGWEQVLRAIRCYGSYRIPEALESMDEITRECVRRLGFAEICSSENLAVDRANFRSLYEQISERKKLEDQTPASVRALIEKMSTDQRALTDNELVG